MSIRCNNTRMYNDVYGHQSAYLVAITIVLVTTSDERSDIHAKCAIASAVP